MTDDMELRRDVLAELLFEPRVDAGRVAVAVTEGIVTLAGTVGTYAEKAAAEQAALRVRGVRGVAQEIRVVLPQDKKTGDVEIATRAANIIAWDTSVPEGRIKVRVQSGWLTLNGEVEWNFQKVAAESAVRKLSGVLGITNLLRVTPVADPYEIKARIESAFLRNADLEASAIRVEVSGDKVTLEGHVQAWAERSAAENAAWSVPGVMAVEDRLLVG